VKIATRHELLRFTRPQRERVLAFPQIVGL
jgi:hypothetical protein